MNYHPRHDIYHCCFRILSILKACDNPISIEKIRIIDFYIVFPNFVKDITLPRGNTKIKNEFCNMGSPFELMPNKKILFSELKDFQHYSIILLQAKNLIEVKKGLITKQLQYQNLPEVFFIENSILRNEAYLQLIKCLVNIDMTGKTGLKQRTGLMEYRYDTI